MTGEELIDYYTELSDNIFRLEIEKLKKELSDFRTLKRLGWGVVIEMAECEEKLKLKEKEFKEIK